MEQKCKDKQIKSICLDRFNVNVIFDIYNIAVAT